jgi:D-3-phosphoglycerate dehydrogenase
LVPEEVDPAGKNYLLERGYELKVGGSTDIETLKREIADVDGVLARLARYPQEVLEAGTKLKVVGRHGVGTDNVAVDWAEANGIWVVNTPLANGNTVAEYAIAMIMALGCDIMALDKNIRTGGWNYRMRSPRREIKGRTLGIVGLGKIGSLTAEKASRGLGMEVIAYHPRRPPSITGEIKITNKLDELLKAADYVLFIAPSTHETKGMCNYGFFSTMKRTAFFIDCARGDTYVEADLVRALEDGRIAGAAIDVFDPEPKPDSPLFRMDTVIVSPHSAGLSVEASVNMSLQAAIGIDEVLRGDIPAWPVNHPEHPRAGKK